MRFEIEFDAMTSFYDNYDYYKKMLQLQERLRKSEEERIRLEERFKTLMQESRNRHYTCISRLRLRYIEFLEEQRTKNDKNHKLLETLNNVDNSLLLMTAKINRLNVLKEQYENYHRQIYEIRSQPENTISGIDRVKEIENRTSKKHSSLEVTSKPSPQMIWLDYQINPSISSSTSNLTSEARSGPKLTTQFKQINDNQIQNDIQSVPLHNFSSQYKPACRQVDSDLYVSQKSSNSLSKQSGTFLSESPKRMEIQVQSKYMNSGVNKLLDVTKAGSTQGYISPYRPENRKILNDTSLRIMSENYKPAPIILRRNVPNISSSLPKRHYQSYLNYPSRSVNRLHKSVSEIPTSSDNERFTSKDLENIRISQDSKEESESRVAMAVENELDKYIANIDKLHREHDMQNLKRMEHKENKNTSADNDQQIYMENQSNENGVLASTGDLASKTIDIPVSEETAVVEKSEQLSKSQEDQNVSSDKFMEQNVTEENYGEKLPKESGVFVSKESQLDHCSFETAEALKPWDLDSVQKQIMEAKLSEENEEEFGENNVSDIKETEEGKELTSVENQNFEEDINTEEINELKENIADNYETSDNKVEEVQYYANNENVPENYTFEEQKAQAEECYGTNQSDTQEYNDQNCTEESNQADNFEAEQFNLNEDYSYNQNTSYEENQNLNYDQNVSSHEDQQEEYAQESNQYEQGYNVQSEGNLDQQNYQESDANQVGETNVDQSYEYTDFNQTEIVQKNEDKEEQPQQEEEVSDQINASQNQNTKAGNESNPKKDVIKSLLDSDTDTTIERNVSNTESDFDFN